MATLPPFDGAFDALSDALGDGEFTAAGPAACQYVYKGRTFAVTLHRNRDGQRWMRVTPPGYRPDGRPRGHQIDRRRWTGPAYDNWPDAARYTAARIRRVTDYMAERAADEAKHQARTAAVQRAQAVADPLKAVVKHDDRMGVSGQWWWGKETAVVVITVQLPEDQWHHAQMIVDFLKEGCGDPRPATVATEEE